MTSTYSTNKYLEEPGTNDQVNTWGGTLNTNFSRIDAAFGSVTSINLNGVSGNLDLNNSYPIPSSPPYSYIPAMINLSGAPAGNVTIRIPSGIGGVWSIYANFTGNYTVTFLSLGGGASVQLLQSYNNQVMVDGTNVRLLSLSGRSIGTSANNLVALDSSAKLPAVDGSQLTNLPGTVPSGAMMSYAGISEPSGWLFCDGRAINRVTYAALFAAIGTTYGPGDGSTTFNIPDLRGRVLAGKDNMGTMGSANRLTTAGSGVNGTVLGATGGAETITLVESEMPAHYHLDGYVNGTSTSSGSYGSTVAAATNDMDFAGTGTAHPNTSTVGGGQPHDNVQPTLVANTIIKT